MDRPRSASQEGIVNGQDAGRESPCDVRPERCSPAVGIGPHRWVEDSDLQQAGAPLEFHVMRLLIALSIVVVVLQTSPLPALGAETVQGTQYFEKHVRPLLSRRCYACHSADSDPVEGGLRLAPHWFRGSRRKADCCRRCSIRTRTWRCRPTAHCPNGKSQFSAPGLKWVHRTPARRVRRWQCVKWTLSRAVSSGRFSLCKSRRRHARWQRAEVERRLTGS